MAPAPPESGHLRAPVVLMIPHDANVVVTGSPVSVWSPAGERVWVLPAGAVTDPDGPVVPMLNLSRADALRVASGQRLQLHTCQGQPVEVRIPTVDELLESIQLAIEQAAGMTAEDAARLVRPLDLAEVAADLAAVLNDPLTTSRTLLAGHSRYTAGDPRVSATSDNTGARP